MIFIKHPDIQHTRCQSTPVKTSPPRSTRYTYLSAILDVELLESKMVAIFIFDFNPNVDQVQLQVVVGDVSLVHNQIFQHVQREVLSKDKLNVLITYLTYDLDSNQVIVKVCCLKRFHLIFYYLQKFS